MGKRITIKWRRERAITSLKDDGIHQQIEDPVGEAKPKAHNALRRRKVRIVRARRSFDPEQAVDRAHQLVDHAPITARIEQFKDTFEELIRPEVKESDRNPIPARPERSVTWDIEKATDMRSRGCTWGEIGKSLEVSPTTVRNYLIRHGLYETKKQLKMQWDVQEAFSLWKNGLSFREVAARVGTAEPNVRKAFMRRGWLTEGEIFAHADSTRLPWDVEKARQLRESGLSWDEIGAQVGTVGTNVREAFIRRGWPRDPGLPNPDEAEDVSTPKAKEIPGSRKAFEGNWDIEKARRLRKKGMSWKAIAERVGSSMNNVREAFQRLGWLNDEEIARPCKPFRGKWDIEEARRLREQGLSFREIAERVGSSERNVRKTFRRRGWTDNKASSGDE